MRRTSRSSNGSQTLFKSLVPRVQGSWPTGQDFAILSLERYGRSATVFSVYPPRLPSWIRILVSTVDICASSFVNITDGYGNESEWSLVSLTLVL